MLYVNQNLQRVFKHLNLDQLVCQFVDLIVLLSFLQLLILEISLSYVQKSVTDVLLVLDCLQKQEVTF